MKLIRIGSRSIDLDCLISAEDVSPGHVRLTMKRGDTIDLAGRDAREVQVVLMLLRHPACKPEPEPEPQSWRDRPPML